MPILSLDKPADKCWNFSFRYWQQTEFFGLSESNTKWFVSLLERLKQLSGKAIEPFLGDRSEQGAWRYHPIDWGAKNIPLQRHQFTWVAEKYIANESDFPLVQFQVSKAKGRIVGFWDENTIFNIVLLDPLHNLQPSQDYGYKVDPCSPLSCDYTSLLYELDMLKKSNLCSPDCGFKSRLDAIPSTLASTNVLMHYVSDQDRIKIDAQLAAFGDQSSYTDLMMLSVSELNL